MVFAAVLLLALIFSWLGLRLEDSLSFQLIYAEKATGHLYSWPMPYGSYGMYLARLDRPQGFKRVFLLGNSVYQSCGIVDRMQDEAYGDRRRVLFYNLGMAGAGAYDYMVNLGKVLAQKPDLVVIAYINLAFSPDWTRQDELPRFRTDADLMSLDPEVVENLPWSFFAREFSWDDWLKGLSATFWRATRDDTILRHKLDVQQQRRPWLPGFVRANLGMPTLNLVLEWTGRTRSGPRLGGPARAYASSGQLIAEMVEAARRAAVPILFLRQESGPNYLTPEVRPLVETACRAYPQAFSRDLMSDYRAQDLPDQVHPRPEAAPAYAHRHYQAIAGVLDALGASERGGRP